MSKKVDLTQPWLWKGGCYGPGKDTEVPDDFPKDIEKRLLKAKAAVAPTPQSPAGASGSGTTDIGKDYDSLSKDELLAEATLRNLDVKGSGANGNIVKDDLVAALKADDAAKAGV